MRPLENLFAMLSGQQRVVWIEAPIPPSFGGKPTRLSRSASTCCCAILDAAEKFHATP